MRFPGVILFLILLGSACNTAPDAGTIIGIIEKEIKKGNIDNAARIADSLKKECLSMDTLFFKADSLAGVAERIGLDYTLRRDELIARIERIHGPVGPEDMEKWERNGWLEGRMINGKMMYFNRAASNLILLNLFHENRQERNKRLAADKNLNFRLNHILKIAGNPGNIIEPVRMKISYTLTVEKDAVPEGEIIRCWLPWPRSDHPRQYGVEMLSVSSPEYVVSPDSAIHSTIYLEQRKVKGEPAVFNISFIYESSARHFTQGSFGNEPYDKSSGLYQKFTTEQLPQINFSPEVRKLAGEIPGNEEKPAETVRNVYMWFKENVPWTGALEYSIMEDIPGYVCRKKTGDCGMQTFLFMSLLRYKGIPVRWQSGWMVPPSAENLHDWCEVYYEDAGWLPVDISYDMPVSNDKQVREFYLSGIDSYRLIVNNGIAGKLYPPKKYLRSEPYDFQRGEVEWSGGNLYFDKWEYDIKIEYLNR